MKINFRQKARESLLRAKSELNSQDIMRVYYAALELRMAIEALTYDRAQAYAAFTVYSPRTVSTGLCVANCYSGSYGWLV